MTRVFVYIVAASPDPDFVNCAVPYAVDSKEIFFGPCKKGLRERLREENLDADTDSATAREPLVLVGLNAGNRRRVRKVVWAGRISRIMTFARAFHCLSGRRYQKMRSWEYSPLHLEPIYEKDRLVGYEHRSLEHAEHDAWVLDLVRSRSSSAVEHRGRQLILRSGSCASKAFPRDVCFTLENLFFADGDGLTVDEALLSILRRAQPDRRIDQYAVFGYRRDRSADGRTGSYLEIKDSLADGLVAWLAAKTDTLNTGSAIHEPHVAPKSPRPC